MTRHAIWQEGDFFNFVGDKRKKIEMDPATVELPTERVPLTWSFENDLSKIYGWVNDFRFEDGEITANVIPNEERVENLKELLEKECRLAGYYQHVLYANEEKTQIASAKLRGVSIILKSNSPGWPEN